MIAEVVESLGEAPDKDKVDHIVSVFGQRFDVPSDHQVTIVCLNEDEICNYNRDLFKKDEVTDVISVNMDEQFEDGYLWGEIYISTETAQKEAVNRETSWEEEAFLYIVHGLLHLTGFEDSTEAEQQEMWDVQMNLLEQCGLSRNLFVEE